MATKREQKKDSDINVPPWVILATYMVGWGIGGGGALYEFISGDYNVPALLFCGWLITLPLVATRPLEVLSKVLGR